MAMAVNLLETKQELLRLLDAIIDLAKSINTLLNKDDNNENSSNSTKLLIDRLEILQKQVEFVELRTCIVAPTKAGKSTIINAVLGQKVLPTRNAAMTVIPTEIVLQAKRTSADQETSLSLDPVLIDQLHQIKMELRQYFHGWNRDKFEQQLPDHPHLIGLACDIQKDSSNSYVFNEQTVGSSEVLKVLQSVHDTIRLRELMLPNKNTVSSHDLLKTLPRISASYIGASQGSTLHESIGSLVMVDTPGPNEDISTLYLKDVMVRELNKAAIVLVVLDFTSFNTHADKIVKDAIEQLLQSKQVDKDSLFALVNKVDQRRAGDLSTCEVNKLVCSKFGIGNVDDEDQNCHVFEVQALYALLANQFFQELKNARDQNQPIDYAEFPSGKDFLREAYGALYNPKMLPDVEQVTRDAQQLWNKSGFESFLSGTIQTLIKKVTPKLFNIALGRCSNWIAELQESVTTRAKLLETDKQKLESEIQLLEADKQELSQLEHNGHYTWRTEYDSIEIEVKRLFDRSKNTAQDNLNSSIEQALREHHAGIEHSLSITQTSTALNNTSASFSEGIFSRIRELIRKLAARRSDGVLLEFKNEETGRHFVREVENEVLNISQLAIDTVRDKINEMSDQVCSKLNDQLYKNTSEILLRAQQRFAETFDIKLQNFGVFDHHLDNYPEKSLGMTKSFRFWWWFLHKLPTLYEDGYKDGIMYRIDVNSLRSHCKSLLETNMNRVENQLNNYLKDVLKETWDQHFDRINQYFNRYKNYIQQSLDDQYRTVEDKEKFHKELLALLSELEKYKQNTDKIRQKLIVK